MTVYLINPKNSTREHLQLIKNFSKGLDIKLTQANQKPSYTKRINHRLRKKLWKWHPSQKPKSNINYFGVTQTKQYKFCMTGTSIHWRKKSMTTSEDENFLCSWIGRINLVKLAILPKAIPMKITINFFIELESAIFKFFWNIKKPKIAKTIINKKRISVRISVPNLKQCYRLKIKTTRYWWQADR